jgi:6-phosphogluconolactonase
MGSGMSVDILIYPDGEVMSQEVARAIVHRANDTLMRADYFTLCLAGGQTPRTLYRVLATEYRGKIPWSQLNLFWGDERYVARDDPRSNYRLVRESLLDHVPIPAENVHPMPTDLPDPEDAAAAYEHMLRGWFRASWPQFDLVLLGMGPDGHTASLFPGSPVLAEETRWVVAAHAAIEPRVRLTLTLPAINHASLVFFLVTGSEKAHALRLVLTGRSDPNAFPAAAVRPQGGDVLWWLDEHAARLVPRTENTAQVRR